METITLRQSRLIAFSLAFALACLAVRPVTANEESPSVIGRVTLNGQPLGAGWIVFYLDNDEFVGSKIKDGAFKVTRVPVGTWRVTIECQGWPAKFASEETSGLRVAVEQGKNTFEFDLQD